MTTTLTPPSAFAGKLDDFERRANEDSDGGDGDDDDYGQSYEDDEGDAMATAALIALTLPIYGAMRSWERVRPGSTSITDLEPRKAGEATIAFARVDAAYQLVESDVDAWDVRAELGFGPFAIQARETHYDEDQPSDSLDLVQAHALLRTTVVEGVELDLGIGGLVIDGNNTSSGFSGTIPILIHPWDFVGLEFRPTWASVNDNTVGDYDLSLLAGWRFISARVGYRWTNTGEESLNGPIFGVAARW